MMSSASERHLPVLEASVLTPVRSRDTLVAGALSQIILLSSRSTNFSRV